LLILYLEREQELACATFQQSPSLAVNRLIFRGRGNKNPSEQQQIILNYKTVLYLRQAILEGYHHLGHSNIALILVRVFLALVQQC
jgi:hypothetical protein